MIGVFNSLRHANALIRNGRFADVESVVRDVLAADRANAFATMILARAEMEQRNYRDSIAHYRTYAKLAPSSADVHHWIAICWSRLGDVDRALGEGGGGAGPRSAAQRTCCEAACAGAAAGSRKRSSTCARPSRPRPTTRRSASA